MKNFFSLLFLFFKNHVFSRSFIGTAATSLILIASFACLTPKSIEPSAKIGIIFENSDQRLYQSCSNLLNLQEIAFIRYDDEQVMCRDVMSGVLHCGYKLGPLSEPPITVFETSGSILTPVLDELVFSAWYEARMLNTTPELYGDGYSKIISSEIERLELKSRPLSVDITVNTLAPIEDHSISGFVPVLYSVFIPLILLSAVFCAVLPPTSEHDTVALILANSVNRRKAAFALFLSQTLSFSLMTFAFEFMLLLFAVNNGFSVLAKAIFVLVLSVISAIAFHLFSKIRPTTSVLFLGIVWAAVSIVFSGAFVSPAVFGSFEYVKYLSPSWLLLQLMTALTAI